MFCTQVTAAFVCLLLSVLCGGASSQGFNDLLADPFRCEEIPIRECRAILPYNLTAYPNILNQRRAQDAKRDFQLIVRLLRDDCSDVIPFFVCVMYAPFCNVDEQGITRRLPPCRELCEASRRGCESGMVAVGFSWPFDCNNLPVFGDHDNLCVGSNDTEKIVAELGSKIREVFPPDKTQLLSNVNDTEQVVGTSEDKRCPAPMRVLSADNETMKDYTFGGLKGCGIPCPPLPSALPVDWYFSESERDEFAPNWILAWSIICFIATFLTLLTFLIDRDRFNYPERPIVLLAFCYFLVSIIYIAGFGGLQKGADGNVACNSRLGFLHQEMNGDSIDCAVQFLVLYFFTIASALWWVILTLTWYLAAGLAWGTEAINRWSSYFHLFAWTIPALLTIIVLALQKVDGDYLSGVCFVGVRDLRSHNIFVVAPLLACLLLGTFFLLAGFYSMFRIRSRVNINLGIASKEKQKLEKFMARIGIFSVLYTVPAAIVVGCLIYESANRETWEKTQLACARDDRAIDCTKGSRPSFVIFMSKYLMLLLVGITSGFWIWSRKTVESWQSFLFQCRCIVVGAASTTTSTRGREPTMSSMTPTKPVMYTAPYPRPAAAAMGSQPMLSGPDPYAYPAVGSYDPNALKRQLQESDV
uniref:Frizzled A1 n=1 Tax=Oscarella carmela TaxID=386100 RepID=A0A0B5CU58_OSCCA|nr:frizzled A1 [Oscarella carmela]|eukprot:m.7287 g.7287  ORF g.7287 m.7287 type:complete len:642 (+) comp18259_c0_seq1:421-2346(+)